MVPFRATRGIALMAILAATPFSRAQESPQEPVEATPRDVFLVRVDPTLLQEAPALRTGRLLVLLCESQGRYQSRDPLDAPFLSRPQPIASIAVTDLDSHTLLHVGDGIRGTHSTPGNLDRLNGTFNVRAVFDPGLSRGHDAPGNPVSELKTITMRQGESQTFELELDRLIPQEPLPELPNLKFVEIESPLLSAHAGRPIVHRAGVALPPEYNEPLAKRRYWPTIYVVPAFGGDHRNAAHYARLLANPISRSVMPHAVWVVLDPNAPLGHHGFVDSQNNGPRETALIEECIPWLEKRFRLIGDPEARIITGHSSGGWSSLWLQLHHPDVFGACFASAPDPVSFAHFGSVNLYRDLNLFQDQEGGLRPSLRTWLTPRDEHVLLTIADEVAMERALAPDGVSGEQWDSWNAMYSSQDPDTLLPRRAFDQVTGTIDPVVIEHDWVPHDIALLSEQDWERYGPIFQERIRLVCGAEDSFYLERAVTRLKEIADARRTPDGNGYIEIIKGADHDTIVPMTRERFYKDMRDHFERALAED